MTFEDAGRYISIKDEAGREIGAIYQAPYSICTPYNLVFDGRDRGHFASVEECRRVAARMLAAL